VAADPRAREPPDEARDDVSGERGRVTSAPTADAADGADGERVHPGRAGLPAQVCLRTAPPCAPAPCGGAPRASSSSRSAAPRGCASNAAAAESPAAVGVLPAARLQRLPGASRRWARGAGARRRPQPHGEPLRAVRASQPAHALAVPGRVVRVLRPCRRDRCRASRQGGSQTARRGAARGGATSPRR
jgi:hypothetical protein